jgi:DNA-directed RNA polymerase subunit RPC12/RpoP
VGLLSGTSKDQVVMFRCGCVGGSGCGRVLTEGQVLDHMTCPNCGSRYFSPYYPTTRWNKMKCYMKLIVRGEAWTK